MVNIVRGRRGGRSHLIEYSFSTGESCLAVARASEDRKKERERERERELTCTERQKRCISHDWHNHLMPCPLSNAFHTEESDPRTGPCWRSLNRASSASMEVDDSTFRQRQREPSTDSMIGGKYLNVLLDFGQIFKQCSSSGKNEGPRSSASATAVFFSRARNKQFLPTDHHDAQSA